MSPARVSWSARNVSKPAETEEAEAADMLEARAVLASLDGSGAPPLPSHLDRILKGAAGGLGKTQRSSAPVLIPYHPERHSKSENQRQSRKNRELRDVPDILLEIRGLPTRPQGDSDSKVRLQSGGG
jgi:hypothetical protein